MENKQKITNKTATPLWVISLFVSLTEVMAGITATQTTGGIQLILTLFLVFFPFFIALCFFIILWKKPYVFYTPTDFHETNVENYVAAMQTPGKIESELIVKIENEIKNTFSSIQEKKETEEKNSPSNDDGTKLPEKFPELLDYIYQKTTEKIDSIFISIDTKEFLDNIWQDGNLGILKFNYNGNQTVSKFLDEIYYSFPPWTVEPYSYGKSWLLQDKKTNKIYADLGVEYCKSDGAILDSRSISSIGIKQGDVLKLISPP